MRRVSLFLGLLSLAGCLTLPPTASFNLPANSLGMVEANAWLKRVEITDPAMTPLESRAQIENALTNNLSRFLRDGKYFRKVELLPGIIKPEDLVLWFVFDRYRKERHWRVLANYDTSDLSASLTLMRSDGTVVREARASVKEEHMVDSMSPEAALPSGMKARTQLIEELLQKALLPRNSVP